jgi:hypothetical protein
MLRIIRDFFRRWIMILNIMAYGVIPIFTFLFVRGTDLFTTNFSVIGNTETGKFAFILWGIIIGFYFYYVLRKMIACLPRNKGEIAVSTSALVLLAFAMIMPYLPDLKPLKSFLHVLFSFLASVLLLISLYMIIWKLYCMNRQVYKSFLTGLNTITLLSVSLLFLAGIVSSALEIFFIVSCTVLIRKLYDKVIMRKRLF